MVRSRFSRFSRIALVLASLAVASPSFADGGKASATISIKADVSAKGTAQATSGDAAYAAGKFDVALAAYGAGFATARDSAFIYAMAECHKALGHKDDAQAMFKMYLGASNSATAKYKGDAEAEMGVVAKGSKSAVGGVLGSVKDTTTKIVTDVGGGVYSVAKVSISSSVSASAKASAKAGDDAYAAGKFEDAAKSYAEAYTSSQQAAALYAEAQAKAQAGHGVEAKGALAGYLVAQPNGTYAKDAQTLLLALGGRAQLATKVSVKAKVAADVKAKAEIGDSAMAAGKFVDAANAYGEAYAKKSDAALLYAKGMAQFYAGMTAEAATSLKAYLAASGSLEFKASAEATLHASAA